jgi:LysR family transcriptional activator of nhaA
VLADFPATASIGAGVYNHLLGQSRVAVFGAPKLTALYAKRFPRSLAGAPFLLPTPTTALRRSLDSWFATKRLVPTIRAEIEDSALLKTFAASGAGLFVAPVVVAGDIERRYGVKKIGELDGVTESIYAITARRKVDHPAVAAILDNAKDLFAAERGE